jgi:hypothetical protein
LLSSDSKRRFLLNESFVKRTINDLDTLVDKKLMSAHRKDFKARVAESLNAKEKSPGKAVGVGGFNSYFNLSRASLNSKLQS